MDTRPVELPPVVPTAAVAIFDDGGRLLLGRRRDDGSWCLPGGRLEAGESFAECARRECREELGHEVELHGIIAALSNPSTQIHHYPDGRTIQLVGLVFRGRLGARLNAGSGELTEVDWFTSEGLLDTEIMPSDLPAIRHAFSSDSTPLID